MTIRKKNLVNGEMFRSNILFTLAQIPQGQVPHNFLVTSWRLPRNICYWEVTGKLVPVEFELYYFFTRSLCLYTGNVPQWCH